MLFSEDTAPYADTGFEWIGASYLSVGLAEIDDETDE